MFYLLLRRYLAYISAMGKYSKGLCNRASTRDFICAALILLCVAVAGLWFYNQKAQKLRSEAAPLVNDTAHSSKPKAPEITKPGDKLLELLFLAMMERLQQENSRHANPTSAHGPQEGNEEIEQGSTHNGAEKQETADGGHHEGVLYPEDGSFHGPVDEGHDRTEADLVRCIVELERAEPAQIERAIRDLWIVAADVGVPEEALDALEYLVMQNHDPEVIKQAEFALADLRRLIEMKENALMYAPTSADNSEEDQTGDRNVIFAVDGRKADLQGEPESPVTESSEQSAIFQVRLEELREQALLDTNEASRKDAIQTLSNYRSEAAVDVLLEATDDPDPNNRYKALQALWFSAADGLQKDNNIWLCLQQAQGDSDERVAELAAKALADLDHLEAARREAETALPSNDDHTLDLPIYNEDGTLISRD